MKIVISPAKSLNLDKELPTQLYTESAFLKQAETIQKTLKNKKPKQLMELMHISEKLGELNPEISHSIVNKNFMQVFSLIESTQSTRIEGTQVTFTEVLEEKNTKNKSSEITEVLNYQKALNRGIDLLKANNPISTRLMQELHRILMENSRGTVSGSGEYRKIQNHIGPDNNIENAVYIPIGAQDIGKYMANLEFFINNEQHTTSRHDFDIEDEIFDENSPGLIKTAIVHAQF